MTKEYKKSVFIFRRDLRLIDNAGLIKALENSEVVIPLFIFDDNQTSREKNPYFSDNAFLFMLQSLEELASDLKEASGKLFLMRGDYLENLEAVIKSEKVEAVFANKDYTPFARKRDKAIADLCDKNQVNFDRADDYTISPIESIKTGQDKPYAVFTPFMKKAMLSEVAKPQKNNHSNYHAQKLNVDTCKLADFSGYQNPNLFSEGGRSNGLKLLKNISKLKQYKQERDLPAISGTSRLSPHHKFGTISIRETYEQATKHLGTHNQFVYELYWRDFYLHIAYHFPIVFKGPLQTWSNEIEWLNDKAQFSAWCEGKTGVPMVDAGMRQLNETGWMHNRVRMVVSSYLTKNLLIDWRWGERYFASKLVDYDPSANNGGWQWSASVGADPKPMRIFNPFTQAQKFDPDAVYIKTWVTELKAVDSALLTDGKTLDFSDLAPDYPAPLVDQKDSYHRAFDVYKTAKAKYKFELAQKEA